MGVQRPRNRLHDGLQRGSSHTREGLYSSHLSKWRGQREAGALAGLSDKKRGRKPRPVDPEARRVAELERENARLRDQLEKAETIISVQKKLSRLLESSLSEAR